MAAAPYTVTRIGDVEPIPALSAPFSVRLLRRELDVHAFGINAYSAPKAGDQVIEEHDELGGGAAHHEELYLVTSGRATFTVDGETQDAPRGMLVFVPDTTSRRGAVAAEDDTTILVVGGTAGAPYRPGGWEWSVAANPAYLAGDYAEAIRVASKGLEDQPRNSGLLYNLACFNARAGDGHEAVALLRRAYEINPDCRTWAEDDADLDSIRDREDWPL